MDRKHATYIIFHPKSLVSLLMHLCHMLLELGNWYRHSAMWHWEWYATIKLFPVHASTEVAYLRYQLHWVELLCKLNYCVTWGGHCQQMIACLVVLACMCICSSADFQNEWNNFKTTVKMFKMIGDLETPSKCHSCCITKSKCSMEVELWKYHLRAT